MPSPSPRPTSTRRRSATCTRAPWPWASSRRRWNSSSWRGRRACGRPPRRRCPRSAPTSRPSPSASGPASTSPTTRRSRASKRELTAEDYVYSHQAPLRPALEERQPLHPGKRQDPGPVGTAQEADRREEALRLRHAGGGPARAGPLHLPGQAGRARAALPLQLHRRLLHRRAGARGGRVLRRQASASTRWAPAPSCCKEWKRSSRIVLAKNPNYREVPYDETPAGRRRAAAGRGAAVQGPQAAARRRGAHLGDRGAAAALAVVPERGAGPHRERAGRVRQHRLPEQQARAATWPRRASRWCATRAPTSRCRTSPWSTRWSAATSRTRWRCAAPSRWRWTWTARSASCAAARPFPRRARSRPRSGATTRRFKTEMSDFDRARAKALLDMHGYVDRNGDGWREQPDGQPLLLEYATSPDQQSRQLSELWKKNMDAIGIRIEFKTAKWPENLKASRAGKLMMWGVGWSAGAARRRHLPGAGLRPQQGPGQPRALRPAGLQRAVRTAARPARRPRAPGADGRGDAS